MTVTDDFTEVTQAPQAHPGDAGPACTEGSADLDGAALVAWRSYLRAHATIMRALDADLVAAYAMTTRDYEVLLHLAQAPDRRLPMSALAERTMLTRSGITRLIDGLVGCGLIERVGCESDARVSYARLTEKGLARLREAGTGHVASIRRLFLEHFTDGELEQLAELLSRLPGAGHDGSCTAPAADSLPVDESERGIAA